MVAKKDTCDLCGLELEGAPVCQTFAGQEKQFCCQGCERVYEVAYDNDMLEQVLPRSASRTSGLADSILDPGETAHFSLDGMWCAGCSVAAEQILRNQSGVKDVDISFAAERGRIRYDPNQVDPATLLKSLDRLGYRGRLLTDPAAQQSERQQERMLLQLITAVAFGMQVMLLYLVQLYPLYAAGQSDNMTVRKLQYLVWLLATPVLFFGGLSFLRGAWRAMWARTATMDTLVSLGTLSAYTYSVYVTLTGAGEAYFDSVAMIITFVMLGRYLETIGGARARKDIRKLLQLQPRQARRQVENTWVEIQAAELTPGDIILIKPGERVPADAEILTGDGALNEAVLTGEAAPLDKGPGDQIFAGTIVTNAALTALVTRPLQETRLAQITRLVAQTLAAKPPIQRLADKASTYFAFGIVGVALLTALGWGVTGHTPAQTLSAAVAVLVVACPCALGLATPLAIAVTLGQTTQAGILVCNLVALETAARTQRIVLDKTGTLTQGQLSVVATRIDPAAGQTPESLLCLAAAVEQYSEHPIARAIVNACPGALPESDGFQNLPGLGTSAKVNGQTGRRVMIGSARFLNVDNGSPLAVQAQPHAERGETIVWLGLDGAVVGFIALRDTLNPSARTALRQLEAKQIRPVMLSGDNPRTTGAVAAELHLADYEGNCSPQEKAARIEAWQTQGEQVAMVGDGVNDAPALAQADLSITASGGTDVAGETSDVILTRSDLTLVPWFIRLSHRTRRIILENLGWAFTYNLIAVPLASLGLISPLIAAVAMASSSLLVVGNSLRLRR